MYLRISTSNAIQQEKRTQPTKLREKPIHQKEK